jgi:hypothetical protein
MKRPKIERWTLIECLGAGLLVGGVWGEWGPTWASMLLGVLLLAVATVAARQGGA